MKLLAVSAELVLLLACLAAAWRGLAGGSAGRLLMVPGAILLGLAAMLGALEYAGLERLADAHQLSSRLAGGIGLPALVIAGTLGLLAPDRRLSVSILLLLLLLAGALFGVPQLGQVLLVAGLLAYAPAAVRIRGLLLTGWFLLLAGFGLAMFARSQVQGPLSWGMSLFHLALALVVSCAILLARLAETSANSKID